MIKYLSSKTVVKVPVMGGGGKGRETGRQHLRVE